MARTGWSKLLVEEHIKVFILQGLLLVVVASPVLAVAFGPASSRSRPSTSPDRLWTLGFLFEVIGDHSWRVSRGTPTIAGRSSTGAWRYTRHPNYFGESVLSWRLPDRHFRVPRRVVGDRAADHHLPSIARFRVRMLERGLSETKPGYREYVSRTSPFFPWPPRRG